jgi:hypothetical protein
MTSAMGHLEHNLSPGAMDGFRHVHETIDQTILVDSKLSSPSLSLGADEGIAADDQTNATFGKLRHETGKLGGARSIIAGQTFPCGGSYKPIGESHAPNGSLLEEF